MVFYLIAKKILPKKIKCNLNLKLAEGINKN